MTKKISDDVWEAIDEQQQTILVRVIINQFRDQFKDKLNVVVVHMPRSEEDLNLDEIKKVANEHGISQPIFVDNEHKLTEAFENQYVPAYYVFDKDGNLRHFQAGGSGMKMLEKRVNRVLDEMEKAE